MRQRLRIAAAGGGGFLVFYLTHRILQGAGPAGASAEAVAQFYVEHRSALMLSEVANGLALLAFILFPAALIPVVRGLGADSEAVAIVASCAVFIALGLVSTAAEGALIRVAGSGEKGAIIALNYFQGLVPVVLALAAVVATTSAALLRSNLLPKWVGFTGLGAAAVFLLGFIASSLGDTPEGGGSIFGVALSLAWVALISGALWWRAGRPQTT
jgi:hypothetical protein